MGSTRRSPSCSRSSTTGALAGSSSRTPSSSISTTPWTLPLSYGGIESRNEAIGITREPERISGGEHADVAVTLGMIEAEADHVGLVDGDAHESGRDGHHAPRPFVDEDAHLE